MGFQPVIYRGQAGGLSHLFIAWFLAVLFVLAAGQNCLSGDDSPTDFFESKIRPLLIDHCYECHSTEAGESNGNLRLDTAIAARKGGDHGAAVIPGDVENSILLKAIRYSDADMEMPPTGKLSDDKIQLLRDWIAAGAIDPRELPVESQQTPKRPSPLDRDPQTHWAFVPPHQTTPPTNIATDDQDVIDAMFNQAAAQQGISPSGLANRIVLIRRLYFDLTGLVPSATEISAFVSDKHPAAYERLVDRLLASPEFGERFGRHWMDVVRYADTIGYTTAGKERRLSGSERYRDWIIRSFGDDMPYDEMIRHQLSGDRTDPNNANGNLDAMGFLTIGRRFPKNFDVVDDRIDVITRGLLGVTVACARCHDHKFDPIPTKDYYALAGVLLSSEQPEGGASPLMMKDTAQPHDERVMVRGQPDNRGDVAPRQFLTAFRKPDESKFNDGSGRAELADRIVANDNPLTYRVMVNRVWTNLIGVPLVDTPSDFGFRTQPPAVPAVLDDLALEFSKHRSIKKLVQRIVLTATYQRSPTADSKSIERDPDNRYAMRGNRRRRDFESLRDSMLQVSGAIDRDIGGEPVDISVSGSPPRRSVYAYIDRQNLPGLFRTFDFASPDSHTPSRHYTTIPQQSLFLLNSPLMIDVAIRAANQVSSDRIGADDDSQWANALFIRIFGRDATGAELELADKFLASELNPAGPMPDPRRLWQYGTASIDQKGFVQRFEPFATFEKDHWQFSSTFPDPTVGYAQLATEHGHPGNGLGAAVVRRWMAPGDGTVTINGVIGHRQEQGDGFRATFAIGEDIHWQEVQKSSNRPYGPLTWPIKKGQSLDLIADDNGSPSYDSFFWRVSIRFVGADGRTIESNSMEDFSGPIADPTDRPLSRREQLAQLLLISNEFAFVD